MPLWSGHYGEAMSDLHLATDFIKTRYGPELNGYTGDNIHFIVDTLQRKHDAAIAAARRHLTKPIRRLFPLPVVTSKCNGSFLSAREPVT